MIDGSVQAELWRRGVVGAWKYDSTEIDMVAELETMLEKHDEVICLAGRRTGKTFIWACRVIEYGLKNPKAQIKYISSTTESVVNYLLPMIDEIIDDAPPDVKPRWIKGENCYRFTNGSRLKIFGTDAKNFRKLRGQAADFTIVDECGFMADLETTITSVLSPQSLRTGGKIILSSSAPDEAGHYFAELVRRGRVEGRCLERTIYQRCAKGSMRQTPEEEAADNARWLKKAIADMGGEGTTAFRREYLNDLGAIDSSRRAMPHFTQELCDGTVKYPGVVRVVEKPKYCTKWVGGDIGFIDQSAFVVGYLTPGNINAVEPAEFFKDKAPPGALVIEDELVAVGKTADQMVPLVFDMERTRFGSEAPFMRVVDGFPEQIERMKRAGLDVYKTRTDRVDAAIDEVQTLFKKGLLIIHPRCTRLVACIMAAVWKKNGDKLERHDQHGHFDLMMALVYLVRNLRRYADPYPHGHNSGSGGPDMSFGGGAVSETVRTLRAGFKGRLPF